MTWTRPSARPMDWPRRERATTAIPAPAAITRCLAVAAGTGEVLMARLREGRANTARGAAHFLRETVGRVRYGGASGTAHHACRQRLLAHNRGRRLPPESASRQHSQPAQSDRGDTRGGLDADSLLDGRLPPMWPRPLAEPVSKVSNSTSVYTVSRRWERRQEDAASRYGPGADVAVAAVS